MMTRTQLSFERHMLQRAKERAGKLGISLAEYVRRLVAEDLGDTATSTDPTVLFDLGASESTCDIADNKDEMIGEAFGAGRR